MDCKNTAAKLQELLDGILPAKEAATVRSHLDVCASCSRVFQQLSAIGRAVAGLPLYRPSPAFRAKVLASLAWQRRRTAWAAYASAPALALVSSGLAVGGLLLARALSFDRLLAGWRLLCEPDRAAALLKLELARLALLAWQLCGEAASWLPGLPAAFPLQLAAGMLLAGVLVAFAARGLPRPALSSNWRSS
jgi:predicted anti-sigma-YlaC factor YlaD